MDPITPAATPPLSSPVESTSYLDQNHSLSSTRSVFTLSVCSGSASDKAHPTPAGNSTKKGKLAPMESSSTPKRNLELQINGPGFGPVVVPDANPATTSLLKTLQDTNNELQTHCRDLHQIRLMNPSPVPSRQGSIHSIHPLTSGAMTSALSGSAEKENHPTLAGDAIPKSNQTFQTQAHGFQSGHPLICDLGDLVNLSNANFRLLKTLQDKVNKVDQVDKLLRTEREAIDKERELLKQMSAEVEKERVRLLAGGLGWGSYKMDTTHNRSPRTVSRNRSGGVTPDGTWDEVTEIPVFDEWTEEKEQHLANLEYKLKKANRQWSDEQEEILGPLEKLREEKHQEEKTKRLERQTSNKCERINSREEQLEKAPRKKSGDGKSSPRSSSFKNSLSNIRRKSSVSSLTRRDSSPSGSTTPTRLFRKWFP